MIDAVGITSCSSTDLPCLCTNDAYISKAIHCIAASCSAADAQSSYDYATFACKSAGVTVPSVESVLGNNSSSSSAPAAAPATVSTSSAAAAPATGSAAATSAATTSAAGTSAAAGTTKTPV